jgi:Fe2+ or Zn2+ uptake regulation protein
MKKKHNEAVLATIELHVGASLFAERLAEASGLMPAQVQSALKWMTDSGAIEWVQHNEEKGAIEWVQHNEEKGAIVCERCHQPPVVDYGDGSGLFRSACIEGSCEPAGDES